MMRRMARMPSGSPSFAEVVDALQEIAPLELAAEWDNVGLLLQPKARPGTVARVLLTIDLAPGVVAEAVQARADLVVAYHPPIFQPWRRISAQDPQQQAVLAALAAGLPVYSPHTALDAAAGGLADWLIEALLGGQVPENLGGCGEGDFGRVATLPRATTLGALLPAIRRHLGVDHLQVAQPAGGMRHRVRTVAAAAGAGGGVLRGVAADVWLTGELSHHDARAAVAAGTAVVCAGHSNSERGYLRVLQRRLRAPFGRSLDVRLARVDRDPFTPA